MPKPGFITASMFNKCLTKSVGATVMKQCTRIACERIGVKYLDEQFDLTGIRAIDWGNENEWLAINAYEAETFSEVHSRQVFHRLPDRLVGCHPDGLVGTDGGVEVKCPNSDNHLLNIAQGAQIQDYIYQVQAEIWITGRDWIDFVSFDPRFPEDLRLHVVRIERDEEIISQIDERAALMESMISEMVEAVRPGFRFDPAALNGAHTFPGAALYD